jgi:hypothetical protein
MRLNFFDDVIELFTVVVMGLMIFMALGLLKNVMQSRK